LQGAELKSWLGAQKFLSAHKPVIIFEYEEIFAKDFNHIFGDFIDFLANINYLIIEVVGDNNFVAMHREKFNSLTNWNQLRQRQPENTFYNSILK
jgi:hypothetical protein